jgi:cbb3-type cytochrome oxidase subunit 3
MRPAGKDVRGRMNPIEAVFHAVMIICTIGLWYPVYRSRKSKIARTTRVYRD